ncbi:hypothetical protein PFDG_05377, partial [Plasmodium falciparum Dd2]
MCTSDYDFEFSDIETDDDLKRETNKSDEFNGIEKRDMLNGAKVERDTYEEYNEV